MTDSLEGKKRDQLGNEIDVKYLKKKLFNLIQDVSLEGIRSDGIKIQNHKAAQVLLKY